MRFAFADCILDTDRYTVQVAGKLVALEPKGFDVLWYLLQHADRVIPRSELLEACWPEPHVNDEVLTKCVSKLRQALGPTRQQIIQTVRGRGYQLGVRVSTPPLAVPDESASPYPDSASSLYVDAEDAPREHQSSSSDTPDIAERRQLTVLSAGLADMRELATQLDPEDLHTLTQTIHTVCAEIIERFDGHVMQYLLDGVVAYFGYPQAQDNDAQRAVHAGLALIKVPYQLERDAVLSLRVGIHTGQVVVGGTGSGNLAVGETPVVASSLQDMAFPNTVYITGETAQLTEGYFHWDRLSEHILSDVLESKTVYQVQGPSGAVSRLAAAAPRGLTAFVGRETELGVFTDHWEQAKEGLGQAILLSGEAGIGKSRLVQTFKERRVETPHTLLECQCVPHYQNTALYPIVELLPRLLGWDANDPVDLKVEKLEQAIRHCGQALETIVPLVASLLSFSLPPDQYLPSTLAPQQQRQQTLASLTAMIQQEASRQPTVFILEDLHWADPSTLEWIDVLLEQVPASALLVVLTCRPEFGPPWGLRSYLTPVVLNRFRQSQTTEMVERVTGGNVMPVEIVQHLVEKTDGVPLYIEEMTKAVLESGMIKDIDGQYEVVGSLSNVVIPSTLQDSLMARLDRLGTAKRIAQLGATIGRQFPHDLLQSISPLDETALQRELARLVEAELLFQRGIQPQTTYTFKHALVQDAAYQSLLRNTRQQVHTQIAQALIAQFPEMVEAQPELAARHCAEAHLYTQAVAYWRQAGHRAMERSAYHEAMTCFEQALDNLGHVPKSRETLELAIDLRLDLRLPLVPLWEHRRIFDNLKEAENLVEELGDTRRLGQVLTFQTEILWYAADLENALATGRCAIALITPLEDEVMLGNARRMLAQVYYSLGQYGQAIETFRHNLEDPDSTLASDFNNHRMLGFSCAEVGFFSEGSVMVEEAVRLAGASNNPNTIATACDAAGYLYLAKGDIASALGFYRYGLEVCQRWQVRQLLHTHVSGLSLSLVLSGQKAEALTLLEREMGHSPPEGLNNNRVLGEAYLRVGHAESARCYTERMVESAGSRGERGAQAWALRLMGEIVLDLTSHDQAETHFQQAFTLATELGMRPLQAHCHRGLGTLYRQADQAEQARTELSTAIEMYRDMEMTFWLPETEAALAEVEGKA